MAEQLDLSTITTEQINPASAGLDTLSTLDMLAVFNNEDRKLADAVAVALPRIAEAVDAIAEALRAGGRLFYTGAGTSGRLGVLDASECPPTFNVPPSLVVGLIAGGDHALRHAAEGAEDSPETGAADLDAAGFTAADVLIGIAASGRTPYVIGAVRRARQLGARTAAICCSRNAALSPEVDIPIEIVAGPEIVTGSTRLKAGTVTKMALNMISTGVMVRLGYVYSNLMVNVRPTNEKLIDRAQRIIMAISGVDRARAAQALAEAENDVRTAVVAAALSLDRDRARARLADSGGSLRAALRKS